MAEGMEDVYRQLYQSALDIHSDLRLEEVMTRIIERAVTLLRADSANYYAFQADRDVLIPWVGVERWEDEATIVLERGEGAAGQVLATGRPVRVDRYDEWPHRSLKYDRGIAARVAAVPVSRESQLLGVLTVIRDRQAPTFADEEIELLSLFADQAAIALENARVHAEALQYERLEHELVWARQIQGTLLPSEPPELIGYQVCTHYRPAREVGGDFYDFLRLRDGRWGLVVGDVMDKGIPAALYMSLARTLVRTAGLSGEPPGRALLRVNRHLWNDTIGEVFVTVLYGILQPAAGLVTLAAAGHPPPIHYRGRNQRAEVVSCRGTVLGVMERVSLTERSITLQPGDALLLYSDGLTEADTPHGTAFGLPRLVELFSRVGGREPDQAVEAISGAVNAHRAGQPPEDDLTLMLLRRSPTG